MLRGAMVVLVLLAGCKAELGMPSNGDDDDTSDDSSDGDDGNAIDAQELDAGIDATLTVDATPDARPCAGGDAHVQATDGTCYYRVSTPVARDAANTACGTQTTGATLAIIKNADDQAKVLTLTISTTQDIWIGVNDEVTENVFLWPDGTPAVVGTNYTAWSAGEPNNGGTGEDCGALAFSNNRLGKWDDRACATLYPYICSYTP